MRILIQAKNLTLTKPLETYITKKNEFLDRFDKYINTLSISIKKNAKKEKRFTYEIILHNESDIVKITEEGNDIYSLIDSAHDRLHKLVETIKEKKVNTIPFEEPFDLTTDEVLIDASEDIALTYKPVIAKHKLYSDNRPLHPEEAIEQMEALGHICFLFKNIETNKYAMLYKRNDEYALVEPEQS